jgi:hypothetical protein
MGLNASVVIDPDADTGDPDQVFSDARLGNAAMIGHLHAVATATLGPSSVLVSKVLYSASHGGDFLNLTDIQQLSKELHDWEVADQDAARFKQTMLQLIEVATQRNAIILF